MTALSTAVANEEAAARHPRDRHLPRRSGHADFGQSADARSLPNIVPKCLQPEDIAAAVLMIAQSAAAGACGGDDYQADDAGVRIRLRAERRVATDQISAADANKQWAAKTSRRYTARHRL